MFDHLQRIHALHAWYSRNVMEVRLTPEVERLWLEWLKSGYNGNDLRAVLIYLRRQICVGKRNEGALKLSNIFERSEDGTFQKFDEDLGLSRARANLSVDKRIEAAPDSSGRAPLPRSPDQPVEATARTEPRPADVNPAAAQALADFRKMKGEL